VIGTVVLDIEGTTSSTAFVATTLFPYSRERIAEFVAGRRTPEMRSVLADVRAHMGDPDADDERVVHQLQQWIDTDAKITPLKTIQGWIWQDGFARGELVAHFFPDVVPALRRWHAAGRELVVFSSGSVDAQLAWFGHSPDGDLTPLIAQHFDTENAGPKRDVASYDVIAKARGRDPATIVFLSDTRAELDAARDAGWNTIGVRRPGEPSDAIGVGDHDQITTFDMYGR
jgi:enolase-phosphatase E1